MHWQMVTGLTSALKLIQPQWHVVDLHAFCPGIGGGSVMCELIDFCASTNCSAARFGARWKQASGSTPMPEHIRPQISDRLRFACRSYRRAS